MGDCLIPSMLTYRISNFIGYPILGSVHRAHGNLSQKSIFKKKEIVGFEEIRVLVEYLWEQIQNLGSVLFPA